MSLLDADFVRELQVLKRHLELEIRSGQTGDRSAARRGSSTEFAEHRHYVAGDDLRRIDWFAFARSGQPMLKLFRADEDVIVRVIVDQSASMNIGDPRKLKTAQKLAAALAFLCLSSGLRFQLIGARTQAYAKEASDGEPLAVAPDQFFDARRGKRLVALTLREIEALTAGGGTDIARTITSVAQNAKRPGLLVCISDFFDAASALRALDRARSRGHATALVQVLCQEELNPNLEGDLLLVDVETSHSLDVSIDAAALAAYEQRLNALFSELASWASRRGQAYVRVASDGDLGAAVRTLFGATKPSRVDTKRSEVLL
jgi:uncharacterized protein (DUF58 family)